MAISPALRIGLRTVAAARIPDSSAFPRGRRFGRSDPRRWGMSSPPCVKMLRGPSCPTPEGVGTAEHDDLKLAPWLHRTVWRDALILPRRRAATGRAPARSRFGCSLLRPPTEVNAAGTSFHGMTSPATSELVVAATGKKAIQHCEPLLEGQQSGSPRHQRPSRRRGAGCRVRSTPLWFKEP